MSFTINTYTVGEEFYEIKEDLEAVETAKKSGKRFYVDSWDLDYSAYGKKQGYGYKRYGDALNEAKRTLKEYGHAHIVAHNIPESFDIVVVWDGRDDDMYHRIFV